MLTQQQANRIAYRLAPPAIRKDAAQVALLGSYLAELKGQPEQAGAKARVIDFLRTELKLRRTYAPPIMVQLDEQEHNAPGPSSVPTIEDAIKLLWKRGLKTERIAQLLGKSGRTIRRIAQGMGFQLRRSATRCHCGKPVYKYPNSRGRMVGAKCYWHFRLANAADCRKRYYKKKLMQKEAHEKTRSITRAA